MQRDLILGILIADSTKLLLICNLFTNAKAADTAIFFFADSTKTLMQRELILGFLIVDSLMQNQLILGNLKKDPTLRTQI
jgi:hypothetical protein